MSHCTPNWNGRARCLALTLAIALASSCSTDTVPTSTRDSAAHFQTDSSAYTLNAGVIGYDGSLVVTYINGTTRATSFENCRGSTSFTFEKLVGTVWQSVWSPAVLLCYGPPIVVLPGRTHVFDISVFGGYPDCNCGPRFSTPDIPGLYRIVWNVGYATDPANAGGARDTLRLDQRVSNQFVLKVQSR